MSLLYVTNSVQVVSGTHLEVKLRWNVADYGGEDGGGTLLLNDICNNTTNSIVIHNDGNLPSATNDPAQNGNWKEIDIQLQQGMLYNVLLSYDGFDGIETRTATLLTPTILDTGISTSDDNLYINSPGSSLSYDDNVLTKLNQDHPENFNWTINATYTDNSSLLRNNDLALTNMSAKYDGVDYELLNLSDVSGLRPNKNYVVILRHVVNYSNNVINVNLKGDKSEFSVHTDDFLGPVQDIQTDIVKNLDGHITNIDISWSNPIDFNVTSANGVVLSNNAYYRLELSHNNSKVYERTNLTSNNLYVLFSDISNIDNIMNSNTPPSLKIDIISNNGQSDAKIAEGLAFSSDLYNTTKNISLYQSPNAPTNLQTELKLLDGDNIVRDTIKLTWVDSSNTGGSPILGYVIQYKLQGGSADSYVRYGDLHDSGALVEDLVEGNTYVFKVAGDNGYDGGENIGEYSAASILKAGGVPHARENVILSRVTDSSNSLDIEWDNIEGGDGDYDKNGDAGYEITHYTYYLYYGDNVEITSTISLEDIRVDGTLDNVYTITGLEQGTGYTFKFTATNAIGESPEYDDGTPAIAPAIAPVSAPSLDSVNRVDDDSSKLLVSWTWNGSLTSGSQYDNGGSQVNGFTVQYRETGTTNQWTNKYAGSSDRSLTIDNLDQGTEYDVRVLASNVVGSGPTSNVLSKIPAIAPVDGVYDLELVRVEEDSSNYDDDKTIDATKFKLKWKWADASDNGGLPIEFFKVFVSGTNPNHYESKDYALHQIHPPTGTYTAANNFSLNNVPFDGPNGVGAPHHVSRSTENGVTSFEIDVTNQSQIVLGKLLKAYIQVYNGVNSNVEVNSVPHQKTTIRVQTRPNAVQNLSIDRVADSNNSLSISWDFTFSGLSWPTEGDDIVIHQGDSGGSKVSSFDVYYRVKGSNSWDSSKNVPNNELDSSFLNSTISYSTNLNSLTQGTEYEVKVRAVNEIGDGSNVNDNLGLEPNEPAIAPQKEPTLDSVERVDSDSTKLDVAWTWNGSRTSGNTYDNGGLEVTSFTVEWRTSDSSTWDNSYSVASISNGNNVRSYQITNLTQGKEYKVRVLAENDIGSGPVSNVLSKIPAIKPQKAPSVDSLARVSGSSTQLKLDWSWTGSTNRGSTYDNGGLSINEFYIIVDGVFNTTIGSEKRTHIISSLTQGQSYLVQIAAVNDINRGPYSGDNREIPATVPDTPDSNKITLTRLDPEVYNDTKQTTSLIVNWVAPNNRGSGIKHHIIYVYRGSATDNSDPLLSKQSLTGAISLTITDNLLDSDDYGFKVKIEAVNNIGTSNKSDFSDVIKLVHPPNISTLSFDNLDIFTTNRKNTVDNGEISYIVELDTKLSRFPPTNLINRFDSTAEVHYFISNDPYVNTSANDPNGKLTSYGNNTLINGKLTSDKINITLSSTGTQYIYLRAKENVAGYWSDFRMTSYNNMHDPNKLSVSLSRNAGNEDKSLKVDFSYNDNNSNVSSIVVQLLDVNSNNSVILSKNPNVSTNSSVTFEDNLLDSHRGKTVKAKVILTYNLSSNPNVTNGSTSAESSDSLLVAAKPVFSTPDSEFIVHNLANGTVANPTIKLNIANYNDDTTNVDTPRSNGSMIKEYKVSISGLSLNNYNELVINDQNTTILLSRTYSQLYTMKIVATNDMGSTTTSVSFYVFDVPEFTLSMKNVDNDTNTRASYPVVDINLSYALRSRVNMSDYMKLKLELVSVDSNLNETAFSKITVMDDVNVMLTNDGTDVQYSGKVLYKNYTNLTNSTLFNSDRKLSFVNESDNENISAVGNQMYGSNSQTNLRLGDIHGVKLTCSGANFETVSQTYYLRLFSKPAKLPSINLDIVTKNNMKITWNDYNYDVNGLTLDNGYSGGSNGDVDFKYILNVNAQDTNNNYDVNNQVYTSDDLTSNEIIRYNLYAGVLYNVALRPELNFDNINNDPYIKTSQYNFSNSDVIQDTITLVEDPDISGGINITYLPNDGELKVDVDVLTKGTSNVTVKFEVLDSNDNVVTDGSKDIQHTVVNYDEYNVKNVDFTFKDLNGNTEYNIKVSLLVAGSSITHMSISKYINNKLPTPIVFLERLDEGSNGELQIVLNMNMNNEDIQDTESVDVSYILYEKSGDSETEKVIKNSYETELTLVTTMDDVSVVLPVNTVYDSSKDYYVKLSLIPHDRNATVFNNDTRLEHLQSDVATSPVMYVSLKENVQNILSSFTNEVFSYSYNDNTFDIELENSYIRPSAIGAKDLRNYNLVIDSNVPEVTSDSYDANPDAVSLLGLPSNNNNITITLTVTLDDWDWTGQNSTDETQPTKTHNVDIDIPIAKTIDNNLGLVTGDVKQLNQQSESLTLNVSNIILPTKLNSLPLDTLTVECVLLVDGVNVGSPTLPADTSVTDMSFNFTIENNTLNTTQIYSKRATVYLKLYNSDSSSSSENKIVDNLLLLFRPSLLGTSIYNGTYTVTFSDGHSDGEVLLLNTGSEPTFTNNNSYQDKDYSVSFTGVSTVQFHNVSKISASGDLWLVFVNKAGASIYQVYPSESTLQN